MHVILSRSGIACVPHSQCIEVTLIYPQMPGESAIQYPRTRCRGSVMEFTVLFLATAIAMLVAWRGTRPLTLGLFAAVLVACVATYLHHATDTLKLSF
jgi:hypothetical protein